MWAYGGLWLICILSCDKCESVFLFVFTSLSADLRLSAEP